MNKYWEEFIEKGASLEHERWAKWQEYLHSKLRYSEYQRDGKTVACYIMDAGDYYHWATQCDKGYEELSEEEKESDRIEVRKYAPIIKDLLEVISGISYNKEEFEQAVKDLKKI